MSYSETHNVCSVVVLVREVKHRELAVVFLRFLIICLCCFGFVVEKSDEFALAVIAYLDAPFIFMSIPAHSFIF